MEHRERRCMQKECAEGRKSTIVCAKPASGSIRSNDCWFSVPNSGSGEKLPSFWFATWQAEMPEAVSADDS
jgi:hypothetical protein